MVETIKLATNIPVTIRLQYCDYSPPTKAHPDWPARLRLKADNGQVVYVPLVAGKDLVTIGAISKSGKDRFGNPAFRVTGNPVITILRREEGTKKLTSITRAAGNGAAPPPSGPANGQTVSPVMGWDDLARVYVRAVDIAVATWTARPLPTHPPIDYVAAAATVFIEANRKGLTVPVSVPEGS